MVKVNYLKKSFQHKIYTLEEEREITKNMTRAEKESFWIENNLLFARKESIRYAIAFKNNNRIDEDDLFSVACYGLIRASKLFDDSKDNKFICYARMAIKHEICDFINKNAYSFKIPKNISTVLNKINLYKDDFEKKHGAKPSSKKIAGNLKITLDMAETLNSLPLSEISLDEEFEDSNESSHVRLQIDSSRNAFEEISKSEVSEMLSKALASLNDKERLVLVAKFGDEQSKLSDIGREMNLTRQRIHQIYLNALTKMKRYIECECNFKEIINEI